MSARLLRSFLKRVQAVDRLRSCRHEEHPVRAADVNPDFPDPRTNRCIGFQSSGSNPRCTRRNWKPASRRARAGNARRSARELASQISDLSGIGRVLQYTSFCIIFTARTADDGITFS
jgi:hypothetical protein